MPATRRLLLVAALLAAALVGIAVADTAADNDGKLHDATPQAATSSSPASSSADSPSAAPTEKVQLGRRALLSCMRAGRAVPSPCALYLIDASAARSALRSSLVAPD